MPLVRYVAVPQATGHSGMPCLLASVSPTRVSHVVLLLCVTVAPDSSDGAGSLRSSKSTANSARARTGFGRAACKPCWAVPFRSGCSGQRGGWLIDRQLPHWRSGALSNGRCAQARLSCVFVFLHVFLLLFFCCCLLCHRVVEASRSHLSSCCSFVRVFPDGVAFIVVHGCCVDQSRLRRCARRCFLALVRAMVLGKAVRSMCRRRERAHQARTFRLWRRAGRLHNRARNMGKRHVCAHIACKLVLDARCACVVVVGVAAAAAFTATAAVGVD